MQEKTGVSVHAAALSIFTAAAAESIPQGMSLRLLLLQGVLCAGMLTVLSALSFAVWQKAPAASIASRAAKTLLMFWLAAELVRTFLQAQQVCREEFSSMALIGFLPLLLWAGWATAPSGWDAPARVLWWFAAAGVLILVVGLSGQMQLPRLWTAVRSVPAEKWKVPLYAEYFALPLFCTGPKRQRAAWLPFLPCAVQTAAAFGMVLVFGDGYPGRELLRAWSTGLFSRMDALLLLIWLMCAVFRMGLLCACLHELLRQLRPCHAGSEVQQ